MVKNKPDAYELEFTGNPANVIKCENCGFRAVRYQFDEFGGCPSCKVKYDNAKGKKVDKGKFKKGEN